MTTGREWQAKSKDWRHGYEFRSSDGKLMFKCDQGRADFYINKGLATLEIKDEKKILTLKIEPRGNGWSDYPDHIKDYFLQEFSTNCIVCNHEDTSAHHIFPYCFQRFLSDEIYDLIRPLIPYDIQPLCGVCHHNYEKIAQKHKNSLIEMLKSIPKYENYYITSFGTYVDFQHKKELCQSMKLKRLCNALLQTEHTIPEERKDIIESKIKEILNLDQVTEEILNQYTSKIEWKPDFNSFELWVDEFLKTPKQVDDFILEWREHFISTMKPKFLPQHWNADFRMYEFAEEFRKTR